MSTQPLIRDPRTTAALETLVRSYDRDAGRYRQLIRELMRSDLPSYRANAVEILKADTESSGAHYLVSLLVSRDLLYEVLCDPSLSGERAMAVARMAVRVDPMADVALARRLADAASSESEAPVSDAAGRLMKILAEISDGARILPSLMRLLRTANPSLRSKAVLMIGRANRNAQWVKNRLAEPDARVRANAVQALWGVSTEEARQLLRFAVNDSNNRVAANALVGLYWLGDCSVIPDIVSMTGHSSGIFRSSAAWVIGETGDPRFLEVLGRMLADSSAAVRKRAFAAVGQIKAAVAQIAQSPQWRVSGYFPPADPQKGQRRVRVAVAPNGGRELLAVLPTQFILSEGGQPVWSYKVTEKPDPEAMSVIFVFARDRGPNTSVWSAAALKCLEWKRPSDLWCAVPYFAEDDPDADSCSDLPMPPFTANPELAAAPFLNTAKRTECSDIWTALGRAVRPDGRPVRGKRHLLVLAPVEVGRAAEHDLISAVLSSRTSVQVVSAVPNQALADFCRHTEGTFHLAATDSAIEEFVSRAYLNLLARYEIRYSIAVPDAANLRIRVHAPEGWGETSVAVPAAVNPSSP